MDAHLLWRDVTRVDRRQARSKQGEKRWLRSLQMKGDCVVALDTNPGQVSIPGGARIKPQLLGCAAGQQIPGAFNIGGRERFSVMPLDAVSQPEGQDGAARVR